jgi:hypothetical protein
MFDHTHYVPILKGKQAEYLALRELSETVKDGFTPLIEIPSIPYDFVNERPAKTIKQHVEKVAQNIEKGWGTNRPVFVDFDFIPPSEVLPDGSQPLKFVFDQGRTKKLRLVPVTGIDRDREYQNAVKDANDKDGFGICFRLAGEDFDDMADLQLRLEALFKHFKVHAHQTDAIIDFESIVNTPASTVLLAAKSILAGLPFLRDWRTLTLAASAFPQDLQKMPAQSITPVARTEWQAWLTLAANKHRLIRLPTFGDYAIAHPIPNEMDPRLIRISAQLRYTADNDWLIFKERGAVKHGFDQFNKICRTLIGRAEYKGAAFSAGDKAINNCASPGSNPGNAQVWRRIGTNHHLTLVVVDQLASVPGL